MRLKKLLLVCATLNIMVYCFCVGHSRLRIVATPLAGRLVDGCQFIMPRVVCNGFVVTFGRQFTWIISHKYHGHTRDICSALGICSTNGDPPPTWNDIITNGVRPPLPHHLYTHDGHVGHELNQLIDATHHHKHDVTLSSSTQPLPIYIDEYTSQLPSGIGTFLHLTDLHFDGWYAEGKMVLSN
jgi:hypothetical protein